MAGTTRLAWRNLGRNRRRTLITASALALGTALSVGTYGLMDGMLASILDTLTRYDMGQLQAHADRYLERQSLDLTLPDSAALLARMSADPAVSALAPRVWSFALVSKGRRSRGAQVVGVDPKRERRVTSLHTRIEGGLFLGDEATPWPRRGHLSAQERREDAALTRQAKARVLDELDSLESLDDETKGKENAKARAITRDPSASSRPMGAAAAASTLSPSALRARSLALARRLEPRPTRPPEVVIGYRLAETLHAKVGDELFLVGQAVDGASADLRVHVRGIFKTGTETYDQRVYLHIVDLQHLLHLGGRIHELAARLRGPTSARQVATRLRAETSSRVAIQSWDELRPDMKKMIDMSRASSLVMVLIILFVAVLGVVNTMLMSVFERTRELGILKAIGMSGARVLGLIILETFFLALVAGGVGIALGLGLDVYFMHVGIDLQGLTATALGGITIDPVLRATITLEGLFVPPAILLVASLLASIYPALRAARLRPAVGMREL